jgi:hypothetical protein
MRKGGSVMKLIKRMIYKVQLRHYEKLWKEALRNKRKAFVGSSEWRKWLICAADRACDYHATKAKLNKVLAKKR